MAKGKRTIKKIIVHHSASPPNTTVAQIDEWHKARGWKGIGYHWVLLENGQWEAGRKENTAGAHTKGHNKDSIGVCVTGNFELYHMPAPRFACLMDLLGSLVQRHDLKWSDIYVHKDFAPTACCGRFLEQQLRQALKGYV